MEPQTEEKNERFIGDRVRDVVKEINETFGVPLINAATVPEMLYTMPRVGDVPAIEKFGLHQAFHDSCDGEEWSEDSEVGQLLRVIQQFGDRVRPEPRQAAHLLFCIAAKRSPENLVVLGGDAINNDEMLARLFRAVGSYIIAIVQAPLLATLQGLFRDANFKTFLVTNTLLVTELISSVPKERQEVVLERFREAVCDENRPPTEERTRELFVQAAKN